jgi:hypothetical protein
MAVQVLGMTINKLVDECSIVFLKIIFFIQSSVYFLSLSIMVVIKHYKIFSVLLYPVVSSDFFFKFYS